MPWITRPKASTTTPGASFRPPTPTPPTGLNQRTEYAYAARGLPLTVIEAAGTPLALTTVHAYDTLGRVTQSTVDPTGLARSATYEYDLNNRLIRETGPDGIRPPRRSDPADRHPESRPQGPAHQHLGLRSRRPPDPQY